MRGDNYSNKERKLLYEIKIAVVACGYHANYSPTHSTCRMKGNLRLKALNCFLSLAMPVNLFKLQSSLACEIVAQVV